MSPTAARVLLWILSIFALMGTVIMGHKVYESDDFDLLEFLAFILCVAGYTECIRADERIKISND